ncbi:MAG: RNA methyltransferase [Muribaculum sp.]|nr:RNA methyltransferase [Muribaculum sp.]
MEYPVLSKAKLGLYARLKTSKLRRKERLFTVEGTKCVEDTLTHFQLKALIATQDWLHCNDFVANVDADRIFIAHRADLAKISTLSSPPDVIAVYCLPDYPTLDKPLPDAIYLMLDGIQDPGNLGTIIRTAHWFGIDHILASKHTVDAYNPKTIQSSMGSIAKVRISYCDLNAVAEMNPDIPVCCLDLNGQNIFDSHLPASAFLVMGNEGHGISDSLHQRAAHRYLIPAADPANHPDSLNVAIATAITLAQFVK